MGLRGLFSEARQSGDLVAALHHAEKALAKNPPAALGINGRLAGPGRPQALASRCPDAASNKAALAC